MSERVRMPVGGLSGRKLDAVVAEEVMGFAVHDARGSGVVDFWYDGAKTVPRYSTDIAAAWEVVEKLQADGYMVLVDGRSGYTYVKVYETNPEYLEGQAVGFDDLHVEVGIGEGTTAPLAICRAALKAVRAMEKET